MLLTDVGCGNISISGSAATKITVWVTDFCNSSINKIFVRLLIIISASVMF